MELVCGARRRGRLARSPLRLDGVQARHVQRDRDRARPSGPGDRRGAAEQDRRGAARGREGARAGARPRPARCSRRTRSSRSPTGRSSRSTQEWRRSSSRAGRSATQRWSRRSRPPAPRWCSRTTGTSGHSAPTRLACRRRNRSSNSASSSRRASSASSPSGSMRLPPAGSFTRPIRWSRRPIHRSTCSALRPRTKPARPATRASLRVRARVRALAWPTPGCPPSKPEGAGPCLAGIGARQSDGLEIEGECDLRALRPWPRRAARPQHDRARRRIGVRRLRRAPHLGRHVAASRSPVIHAWTNP